MKQISFWAKKHVWQSRMIILLIYILLNIIGVITGKLLNEINVFLPQTFFIACIIITIGLWVGYPDKKNRKSGVSVPSMYVRRKIFDFLLGAVTFLMIIYAGNNWGHLCIKSESAQASKIIRIPKDSAIYDNPLLKNFITGLKGMDMSKLSQKEKLRLIKKQIKTIKHDSETSKSNKTLLIILSVLAALVLLYSLAALSCSIACAGSEALAILVAIGGIALIIYFLVRIIKRISIGLTNKEKAKTEVK